MNNRYDVNFYKDHCTVTPHFCRDWDENGGCYGSNENHGYSWEDARANVIAFYEGQVSRWWGLKEEDFS